MRGKYKIHIGGSISKRSVGVLCGPGLIFRDQGHTGVMDLFQSDHEHAGLMIPKCVMDIRVISMGNLIVVQEGFATNQRMLGLSRNFDRAVLRLIVDRFDTDNLSF